MTAIHKSYREVFPKKHTFLPVIHSRGNRMLGDGTLEDMRNIEIAFDNGADGVFVINHGCSPRSTMKVALDAKDRWPERWIGVNFLGVSTKECFKPAITGIPRGTADGWLDARTQDGEPYMNCIGGLWADDGGIYAGDRPGNAVFADEIEERRKASGWNGLYFGGVLFKTQMDVSDPEEQKELAKTAMHYMDVPTTSGRGTGIAASVNMIKRMRSVMGNYPLAIASGVTPENVADYMPYADCFLVASGISADWNTLDPKKVAALAKRLREG